MGKSASGSSTWKDLRRLLSYLDHKWRFGIGLGILCVLQSAESVLEALTLKELLDSVFTQDRTLFVRWTLIFIIIGACGSLANYLGHRYRQLAAESLARAQRTRFYESALRMPLVTSEKLSRGDLAARLTADIAASSSVPLDLYLMARRILSAVLASIYMLYLNWQVALATALTGPLVLAVSSFLSRHVASRSAEFQAALGGCASDATNSLEGVTAVKSFSAEGWAERRFGSKAGRVRDAGVSLGRALAVNTAWGRAGTFLPFLVAFGYGGFMAAHGRLTVGSIMALVQLCNQLAWPLSDMGRQMASVKRSVGAFGRVAEILDAPREDLSTKKTLSGLPESSPAVSVQGLSFEYNQGVPVLSDLSFDVSPGSLVVVVGRSGCGKSTLLKILAGLYPVGPDTVCVDGRDIHEEGQGWARSVAAYVPQEPFLFSGTVRENLELAKAGAAEEEIYGALERADALFVSEDPSGLDRDVSERGSSFSGGERQRLAIARTLLRGGALFLLDEPTSSLDKESEERVWASLRGALGGTTCIAATHRLDIAKEADLILVMDGGRIVERGTHDKLQVLGSLYKELINTVDEEAAS